MGAIADNYDLGEAAVKSINAGSDIILVCHEYAHEENVLKTLQKAAANGDIAEERINESVYRILKLKQKYNLSDQTDFVTQEEMNARITAINQRIMKLLGE